MINRDRCGYQKFEVHKLMAAAEIAKRSSFLILQLLIASVLVQS